MKFDNELELPLINHLPKECSSTNSFKYEFFGLIIAIGVDADKCPYSFEGATKPSEKEFNVINAKSAIVNVRGKSFFS